MTPFKNSVQASILILFTLISEVSVAQAEYPRVEQSILCLKAASLKTIPTRDGFLQIQKIAYSAQESSYNLQVGHQQIVDFGTDIYLIDANRFEINNAGVDASLIVQAKTLKNFQEPKRMEPFFANFASLNKISKEKKEFTVKCLHQIF